MIEAKVIADSINTKGDRITTMQVKFHRFILPEFNTHRVFSRNFSSSRAIPTAKLIEQVKNDPAIPVHWGKNQPGMQAHAELDEPIKTAAQEFWKESARQAASYATVMAGMGAHKQIVNRLIEPFMWTTGIVTSTEWGNFFELRDHEDAQPEIRELAIRMKEARDNSNPVLLRAEDWHLPYILVEEKSKYSNEFLRNISAARCCRVSYLKHDGTAASVDEDLELCERLVGSVPLHASPFEHQAAPDPFYREADRHGNFRGWVQNRKLIEEMVWSKNADI